MPEEFAGVDLEHKIIIGVLNLSSETFYEGSLVENYSEAASRAQRMVKNGAEIIDIGAMSTGPGVEPISLEEESRLLLPAIEAVQDKTDVPISIDTQRGEVARKALEAGGDIINDISGLKADDEMPQVVANHGCSLIVMANRIRGRIRTAEKGRKDIESMEEVFEGLEDSLQICKDYDIDLDKVAIDPGIGFGRDAEGDLKILSNLEELTEINRPICLGISRKSFIGKTLDIKEPSKRLAGSLGATAVGVMKGADIIRTHDPKETSHLVRIIEAIDRVKETG